MYWRKCTFFFSYVFLVWVLILTLSEKKISMNSKSKVYECNVHRALAQQQIYIILQKNYNDYSCAGLDPLG